MKNISKELKDREDRAPKYKGKPVLFYHGHCRKRLSKELGEAITEALVEKLENKDTVATQEIKKRVDLFSQRMTEFGCVVFHFRHKSKKVLIRIYGRLGPPESLPTLFEPVLFGKLEIKLPFIPRKVALDSYQDWAEYRRKRIGNEFLEYGIYYSWVKNEKGVWITPKQAEKMIERCKQEGINLKMVS